LNTSLIATKVLYTSTTNLELTYSTTRSNSLGIKAIFVIVLLNRL